MLKDHDAIATIAVKDLGRARQFYEDTLGLEVDAAEEMRVLTCKSGGSKLFVYESEYAGTNQATAATWVIDGDVQEVARALKAKGVAFERYDFPDTTREGDVHVMGDIEAAWFKDPDGNILSIVNG
jgi:catechol 2,3-dioxygenase-like lactoylglutathione lyase family enzyme